jgi:hypothetical protein
VPFPQEELPISVDIAPGASPTGTVDSWDPYWRDITKDVRVSAGISVDEGIPDEANQADPSTAVMTLNNGASKVAGTLGQRGCYSPRNPLGPYYGQLAKNTPLRVRLQRGRDTFARARPLGWGTSDSGIAWSGNTNAALSTDGTRGLMTGTGGITTAVNAGAWDFEATFTVAIDALPTATGDAIILFNFRRSGTTNTYRLWIDWVAGGNLIVWLERIVGGVSTFLASPTVDSPAITGPYKVRIKAEGGFIGARVWRSANPEPTTWQVDVRNEGAYNLDNTALGTNIQFNFAKSSAPVTNVAYFSDLTINTYPFVGTVPEWPVRWDKSANDSWVPLKAAGVLRRLQQGKSPIRSPFYSYVDSLNPSALWMLEDESGANLVASSTPAASAGTFYESDPAGWDGTVFGGTSSQYTVGDLTTISGTLPRMTPNGAWLGWFAFYMPVLPVTNPIIFRVRASGTCTVWDVRVSDDFGGVIYLVGVNSSGTVIHNVSANYTPGQWVVGQVEIQQTGGNFTGRIVAYHVGTGVTTGGTSTAVAGSIGSPNGWSIYGSTGFQEGAAGPVAFFPFIPSVNIGSLLAAARGFAGETAAARVLRLATERGVRMDLISGGRDTLMGIQGPETLLDLLGEAAETDMGLLTEFRGGLRYRTRGRRYSQNVRMALDFSAGHIKNPPEPTDDDQRIRNDITVERKGGGSARAIDTASVDANDLYDESVTINPSTDDVLPGHAGWRLHLGTWDEVRWPSVTIDCARNAQASNFLERATALDPGAHITLANPPVELPGGTIRLLVEAIAHRFGPYEWTMELTCSPYTPWMVPNIVDTTSLFNRVDLVGSTLGSAEAATAVGATDTWTITNTGRDWSTTAVPYYWRVGGEVVQVTAISGTGTQTATVVRGVEGFTKAHTIGETVSLAYPLYLGL